MATQNHEYRISVNWQGGRDGQGSVSAAESGQAMDIRVPPEFNGPGGATNPEELLTSAIAACYSITFGIVATNRKLPLQGLTVEAVGNVEQNGASFVYNRIVIRPTITLAAEATPEQEAMAVDMAMKADHYCIVTNAVRGKVDVSVEPTVVKG